MSLVDVIGLISGALGIYAFMADMLPEKGGGTIAAFRVKVSVDGCCKDVDPKLSNAGGGIQTVRLYNVNGALIGSGGGTDGSIGSGDFADLAVPQSVANQALTAEFYANDDAACIATISATLHDDTKWGWTGDWGKICGLDWYYSGIAMQGTEGSPLCTWIDRDHSDNIKAAVIGITWPGFVHRGDDAPPSGDGRDRCGNQFRAWDADGGAPLVGAAARPRQRKQKRSQFPGDDRLVISSQVSHNATELCQHENSFGPDFYLLEGAYCNMATKEVLPVCGAGVTARCFDLEAARLARQPTAGAASANVLAAQKTKNKVIEW
ncbi:hypothetical protein GE09DRAFT_1287297 [Coniochaeta sp. 2T2.1]|nr:hypothetical protein GE09DRAFT_1287297 [Coniochaeta sp. 2T2.1]